MLIDRESLPQHRPWIVLALIGTLVAIVGFVLDAMKASGRPSGSSPWCFWFGVVGGVIIIFEFLIWPRKKFRSSRLLGRAQSWLRAHIWLGLMCLPLAVCHSGFRLGGWLATLVMMLFLAVIASGVFGLMLQQSLPSRLLAEVPAETIHSQIGHVTAQLRDEADQLVNAMCGESFGEDEETALAGAGVRDTSGPLIVGSLGRAGGVQGRVLQTLMPGSPIPGSEILGQFYKDTIRPFLQDVVDPDGPLVDATHARGMFDDLRAKLGSAADPAVEAIEMMCEQRRQMLHQARLQFMLHSWLWFHAPLSAALVILLIAHVIVAMRYW